MSNNPSQYDSIQNEYDKHMKSVKPENDDIVSYLGLTTKSIDILELGSGSGIDAEIILRNHSNVNTYLGIDNSKGMEDIATERIKDERASFLLTDIDTYNYPEDKFDLVFGIFSVHYTNDLSGLMSKVYQSMKKGGYFVIKDSHPFVGFLRSQSKDYRTKEIVEFPIAGGGEVIVKHPTFTLDEYVQAITNAGFSIVRFEEQMGSQSGVLGIDGFKIPTKLFIVLQK